MNLTINNLTVTIPGQESPILDIPALRLTHGDSLAISGASGSGKTTLINHLCGLARGTPGSVLWGDTDIHALSAKACDLWRGKHIGLIMQDFHLIDGLSALDNVLLPDAIRSFPKPSRLKQRGHELLTSLGITRPEQRVETHSRGEMQRIAIARALLTTPDILIADEPTASLDAENGSHIANLLRDIAQEHNATLICVSHDPTMRNSLNQQLVLNHGCILNTTLDTETQYSGEQS